MAKAKTETKQGQPNMPDFRGKLNYHSQFKKAIEIAGGLIDGAYLNFTEQGVSIKELFDNQTGFLDISVSKKDFERYELPKPLKIAISLRELNNALKCGGYEPIIEITKNKISVKQDGEVFTMATLSGSENEKFDESKLTMKFDRVIKLSANDISEIISKTQKFIGKDTYGHNTIVFSVDNLYLMAKSVNDTKQAEFRVALAHGIKQHEKQEPPIISAFSDDLLKQIMRAKDIESQVEMSFGKNQPLQALFSNGTAQARFVIAPIVGED